MHVSKTVIISVFYVIFNLKLGLFFETCEENEQTTQILISHAN